MPRHSQLASSVHSDSPASAFSIVTSITASGLVGNTGATLVKVGQSSAIGLAVPRNAVKFVVFKETVDNVNETVGTVDATARTVIPTTAPNGTHNYDFFYSYRRAIA